MIDEGITSVEPKYVAVSQRPSPVTLGAQYSLRTLFLIFLFASLFLNAAVHFVRWSRSRPGIEITDRSHWPNEIQYIAGLLGDEKLQDLRIWHMYHTLFDYVWRAKASPEALGRLREIARMNEVQAAQVPNEFWSMPPDWSEMPDSWDPKPVVGAEYYMSPTFRPRWSAEDRVDCVAMYDPAQQVLYVWSQWDF